MVGLFNKGLTSAEIERLVREVIEEAESGNEGSACKHLQILRKAQLVQRDAAQALIKVVER